MRVDAAPPVADPGAALVRADLEAGSLVLVGEEREVVLVWKAGERGEARAVPAGTWRLGTTRVERMRGSEHWFLSSTGAPGGPRELKAGRTERIEVGDTVHFQGMVKRHPRKGEFQFGFSIKGGDGRGLSIYRDDRRVPVTFEVLAKGGKVLASGTMNYG